MDVAKLDVSCNCFAEKGIKCFSSIILSFRAESLHDDIKEFLISSAAIPKWCEAAPKAFLLLVIKVRKLSSSLMEIFQLIFFMGLSIKLTN